MPKFPEVIYCWQEPDDDGDMLLVSVPSVEHIPCHVDLVTAYSRGETSQVSHITQLVKVQ